MRINYKTNYMYQCHITFETPKCTNDFAIIYWF